MAGSAAELLLDAVLQEKLDQGADNITMKAPQKHCVTETLDGGAPDFGGIFEGLDGRRFLLGMLLERSPIASAISTV